MSPITDTDFVADQDHLKAANDTVSARVKSEKPQKAKAELKKIAESIGTIEERGRTFVDVAKDLARAEKQQTEQRVALKATDATIGALKKELQDLTDAIGKRK